MFGISDEHLVPDDELFKATRLGVDTMHFIKTTPLGQTLAKRAVDLYRQAVADFENLSDMDILEDPHKVLAIKRNMDLAKAFMLWVNQTIHDGVRAEETLRARDDSEANID